MIVITVIWDEAKTSVLSPILHNVLLSFVTAILDTMSSSISLNFDDTLSLVEQMRHAAGASPETPIVGGTSSGLGAADHGETCTYGTDLQTGVPKPLQKYIDYWN